MEKYDISVIMLVYNTPKALLDKSITSILKQTYKNFEIILVDDCSTKQETIQTLKDYARKYKFIKIVKHEKNYGMLRGRLTGFKYASGEYIAYLDSDDTMSRDYLRTLRKTATDKKADVVVSTFLLDIAENGTKQQMLRCPFLNKNFDLKGEEIFEMFMKQEGKYYGWTLVWNKLYHRSVIQKFYNELLSFCKSHVGLNMLEDIAFSLFVYLNATHLVSVSGEYVYYYKHQNASTNNNEKNKWLKNIDDCSQVFDLIAETLKKKNLYEIMKVFLQKWKYLYVQIYNQNRPKKVGEKEARSVLAKKFNDGNPIQIDEGFYQYYYSDTIDVTWWANEKDHLIDMICDPQIKVVSFDVFDTLLVRNLFEPKDLFKFLSVEFNKVSKASYIKFDELRALAEENSRKITKSEDVTLDEIYNYIENNYAIGHNLCEHMKQKELELELKFIRRREFGFKLFEIAKQANKKVVFISDFYLSKDFVSSLLKKCGYHDYELYVSCDVGLTKNTSNLYSYVAKDLGIKASSILHIGDNYHSDFEMAQKAGLNAYRIYTVHERFLNEIYHRLFVENQTFVRTESFWEKLMVKSMLGLVQNKIFDNPYASFDDFTIYNGQASLLGYFAVGMDLIALNNWIKDHTTETDCIQFVARDGYLPKLAFDIFAEYNKTLPKTNYLYMSRKAILPLDIWCQQDLLSLPPKVSFKELSIEKLLGYFKADCVNIGNVQSACKNKKISFSKTFENEEEFYRAMAVLDDKCINYKKHSEYISKIIELLKEIITPKNKLFDIGYSGRAESILSKIFGYSLDSLYLHTNWDTAEIRAKMSGFKIDCFLDACPKVTGTIREHIFMKFAPSLIGFDVKNGKLEYVFEKDKTDFVSKMTTEIVQESALEFVRDFYDNFYEYMDWFSMQRDLIIYPYEKYLNYPTYRDKRIFSCVQFEDDLGGVGKEKLIDVWIDWGTQAQDQYNQRSYYQATKLLKFINKVFPVGSRRRKFAKKVYHFFTRKKRK